MELTLGSYGAAALHVSGTNCYHDIVSKEEYACLAASCNKLYHVPCQGLDNFWSGSARSFGWGVVPRGWEQQEWRAGELGKRDKEGWAGRVG